MKIKFIGSPNYLPRAVGNALGNGDWIFLVLKEREDAYLLAMPFGCGHEVDSPGQAAWWVPKENCLPVAEEELTFNQTGNILLDVIFGGVVKALSHQD